MNLFALFEKEKKIFLLKGIIEKRKACFCSTFFKHVFFQLKRWYGNECLGFGLGLCPRSLYLSVVVFH